MTNKRNSTAKSRAFWNCFAVAYGETTTVLTFQAQIRLAFYHVQPELALLNATCLLSPQAGQFLGQQSVDRSPMSAVQSGWLGKLLDRNNMPPLIEVGAR